MNVLVMITTHGFYPIEAVSSVPLEQQAKDNGELNDHVLSVEDCYGKVLWWRLQS